MQCRNGTPLAAVLRQACGIVQALVNLHARGMVHGSLKPQGIMLLEDDDPAVFSDLVANDTDAPVDESLPYMAPERSGRLTHAIDARADLYSVGALLFHMLCGRPPFMGREALSYVHQHVASTPPRVSSIRGDVPAAVCDIVARLLSKDPEARYQSATGLLADLVHCRDVLCAHGVLTPFPLAQHDVLPELRIPAKLYGRAEAIERVEGTLRVALESQHVSALWIAGPAGIGKSSLVRHATDDLIRRGRGLRISGKCELLKRTVPYQPLLEAVTGWVQALRACTADVQAATMARLTESVGDDLDLLCELIPALSFMIPRQIPTVVSAEREQRIHRALRDLIWALPSAETPIVVFIDDLQWSDLATIELIEALLSRTTPGTLCLLLAYRDSEVNATHPVATMQARTRAPIMTLEPLSQEAITAWLRDVLRQSNEALRPLAQRLHRKTAGNPFYLIELTRWLHHEGLLYFDALQKSWVWRVEDIDRAPIADNVADLVRARLSRLDKTTQTCLATAACIGSVFELELLRKICHLDADQINNVISIALREELIVPHGQNAASRMAAFSHDKVTEAAYALCDATWRAQCHGQLGTELLKRYRNAPAPALLFEIVNQLNRAGAMRATAPWSEDLAGLNLQAAQQARASAAFAEARSYYEEALACLSADAWQSAHSSKFIICTGLAECRFATLDIPGGIALCDEVMAHALERRERLAVHRIRIRHLRSKGDNQGALALAEVALQEAGVARPSGDRKTAMSIARERIDRLLNGRKPADLLHSPPMTNPDVRVVQQLITECATVLRISGSDYFDAVCVHGVELSIANGNAPESGLTFSAWGTILARYFDAYEEAYAYGDLALRLAEEARDPDSVAAMRYMMATHFNHWRKPLATSVTCMECSVAAAKHAGNAVFLGHSVGLLPWLLLECGGTLAAVEALSTQMLRYTAELKVDHWNQVLHATRCFCQTFQGSAQSQSESGLDLTREGLQAVNSLQLSSIARLEAALLAITHEDFQTAWTLLETINSVAGALGCSMLCVTQTFLQGYVAARLLDESTSNPKYKAALESSVQRFDVWRSTVPENFEARGQLLNALLLAQSEGRQSDALAAMEAALETATLTQQPWAGAFAAQAAGVLARRAGLRLAARRYDAEVVRFAHVIGAQTWAETLQRRFGVEMQKTSTAGTQALGALDGLSVVKASQTISSEMELSVLLETMLPVVIESVGAERGELLLQTNDALFIEVSARLGARAQLSHVPLAEAAYKLPTTVVNYVANTDETVVFDQHITHPIFGADPYLRGIPVCSVMCAPVARRGHRMGVLYLENQLVNGAFGEERRQVLELLLGQIAISLDASLLFQASQRAVAVRDEFLSVASHELKTPITALRLQVEGFARLLQRQNLAHVPRERLDKTVRTVVTQIGRITLLIDELLDVARISRDKLDLRPLPMDLSDMVRDVLERYDAQLKSARCEVTIEAQPAQGLWDRSHLERVFTNLLQNAMKFGPGKPIDVYTGCAGGEAELSVRDHGIGIPRAEQSRVFDRFARIDSAMNVGGLGLGLFVSNQIVHAHHGHIDVESREGQGAKFRVILPCVAQPEKRLGAVCFAGQRGASSQTMNKSFIDAERSSEVV